MNIIVETLRKPSTGLKQLFELDRGVQARVETLRKPSTGLKRRSGLRGVTNTKSRDTQKTQHGIET